MGGQVDTVGAYPVIGGSAVAGRHIAQQASHADVGELAGGLGAGVHLDYEELHVCPGVIGDPVPGADRRGDQITGADGAADPADAHLGGALQDVVDLLGFPVHVLTAAPARGDHDVLYGVPRAREVRPVKHLPPAADPGPADQLLNLSELVQGEGGLEVDTPGGNRGSAVGGGDGAGGRGAGHGALPGRSCWSMALAAIRSGTWVRKGPPSRAAPPSPLRSTMSMCPRRGGR